jgi:2-C-methyl-D-erythritol 4-phosphate cytidylyltransferase
MDKNYKKLFIIINGKRVFIHSLAQLKELQKQTFFKRVKLAILRALKLKQ